MTLGIRKKQIRNVEKKKKQFYLVVYILKSLLPMCLEDASYAQRRFVSTLMCVRGTSKVEKVNIFMSRREREELALKGLMQGRFLIDRSEQHPEGRREDRKKGGGG